MENFGEYCENLRQQTLKMPFNPIVIVINNGVANATTLTREFMHHSDGQDKPLANIIRMGIESAKQRTIRLKDKSMFEILKESHLDEN